VRIFRQNLALEDAIGSHACSLELEANTRVTNVILLGSLLLLPVGTVNYVATLKAENVVKQNLLLRCRTIMSKDEVVQLKSTGSLTQVSSEGTERVFK
jgi:hypothetical protein